MSEQGERRSAGGRATAAGAMTMWVRLGAAASQHTSAGAQAAATAPAARSGHAMALLSPTNSVLLFGGADGKVFFEGMYLLQPAQYADRSVSRVQRTSTSSGIPNSAPQQAADEARAADSLHWKRLVVSHAAARAPSPRSPLFSPINSNVTSPGASAASQRRQIATLLHPGCGRDYHTMHYVRCSSEEERARGLRVLVVGNVVVATDEARMAHGGGGTQSESGRAGNATQTFDMPTLRVEELRVRQPMLEAQWVTRRVDAESMWKPRARHAHSSVVVGGEQLFVFGGKNATSSTFFNDLFYYDAPLNQWVQPVGNATGQPPQPRAFAGLTASDDGKMLFLFGGTDGKQEFGSLFAYDVVHARWDSLAGATLGDKPLCRSSHSLSFVAPHHLVLFGGRRRAARQNELFIYDVVKHTWRLVREKEGDGVHTRSRSERRALASSAPVERSAHSAVMYPAKFAESGQKLLIFGGYAGSHRWLDDVYLLSVPEVMLVQPPISRSSGSSRSIAATQRDRSTRTLSFSNNGAFNTAHVALSAPQQLAQLPQQPRQQSARPLQQSGQLTRPVQSPLNVVRPLQQPAKPAQPVTQRSQSARPPPQSSQSARPLRQLPQQSSQRSQSPQPAPRVSAASSDFPASQSSRPDGQQQAIPTNNVLTDITNQSTSSSQQQAMVPQAPTATTTPGADPSSQSAVTKNKRRRFANDSQDSSNGNSNSSLGSGDLAAAQVGIQTTLLQLLQHQPRLEDALARIVAMLTKEQMARQQQGLDHETAMRLHSEEQNKRLDAATRRNEALEGRLARAEGDRAELHAKLMSRETELYMHKQSLAAAPPPLGEFAKTIEALHMQQLTVARVIESKISTIHDILDEQRHAGGENTESDDSPHKHLGGLDDSRATQPTPSPPKALLYSQHVVSALEEKLRVANAKNEAIEAQLKETTEKLQRTEGKAAQARQFFLTWCQSDSPPSEPLAALPASTPILPAVASSSATQPAGSDEA